MAALPDVCLLARAARVSAIARKLSKTVDAPPPPTWRANYRSVTPTEEGVCWRVTPTEQGVVKLPKRVREGAEHGGHTVLNKCGDSARRACGGPTRQR